MALFLQRLPSEVEAEDWAALGALIRRIERDRADADAAAWKAEQEASWRAAAGQRR